jgi:tRNA A-37 threonylcarbamoyl transferase component Bud32
MAAPPRRPPPEPDLLMEADRAERVGDLAVAAAALRQHVERHAEDAHARLRFARVLAASGERGAARRALQALDLPGVHPPALAVEVHRALAELDESEGALLAAADRWERILADDIDDAQARAHLAALRPAEADTTAAAGPAETLVSPEGLETLRYRLLRELGRGATAAVYLARDEALGIDVALKVLHPQLAGPSRSEARRRFFTEARVAAAIRHPGVIAIYDVDESARALSMEHVAGGTLRTRLRQRGALPAGEWLATARALLEALGYVHRHGVVHGDLKPSNLLLRAEAAGETVVLADFGAAELVDGTRPEAPDGPAGTPLYLAPEQFRGARPSPVTDLYAAGAILWEMVTGHPMRSHADLLRGDHPAVPLPDDAQAALGAPGAAIAALIAELTRTDPTARPASAAAAVLRLPG